MVIKTTEAKYWITATGNGFNGLGQQVQCGDHVEMETYDTQEEYLARLEELGRELEELPI